MVSFSDGSGYHHGVNVNDASNSSKSQVTVSTVLTVCLTVLFFVAAVFFIFQTRVAVILTLTAALLSVALNHVVDERDRQEGRGEGPNRSAEPTSEPHSPAHPLRPPPLE